MHLFLLLINPRRYIVMKKNADKLLKTLKANGPVGKRGKVQEVIKPWPTEITELLSSQATKVPTIQEITLPELFNIRTIAIQRDVKRRLKKNFKYLTDDVKYCAETGRIFSAVRLPNGELWLIDGNTRRQNYYEELLYCIDKGVPPRIDIPATVTLIVHETDNDEDAIMIYQTYDNANAVETSIDKMSGAVDMLEFNFKNPLLQRANWKTGLVRIAKDMGNPVGNIPNEEYCAAVEFTPELEYFDEHATFTGKPVGGDDVALVLGFLRKNRHSDREKKFIMDFFNKVWSSDGEGSIVEKNGGKNAIAHLRNEYFTTKPNQRFPHRSSKRPALGGYLIYHYELSYNDEILSSACRKSEAQLKQDYKDYFKS
jgi:hypothetical protein